MHFGLAAATNRTRLPLVGSIPDGSDAPRLSLGTEAEQYHPASAVTFQNLQKIRMLLASFDEMRLMAYSVCIICQRNAIKARMRVRYSDTNLTHVTSSGSNEKYK